MVSYQWFVLTWLPEGHQCIASRAPVNPKLTAAGERGAAGVRWRTPTLPVHHRIPAHRRGRAFSEGTPEAVVRRRLSALDQQHG